MDIEELARRVRAIEDAEAIKKLHQRYMDLMDDLRYGEVPDLFTENAEVDVRGSGPKRGRGEIQKLYFGLRDQKKGVRDNCHLAVHPDITVNGDTALPLWDWPIVTEMKVIERRNNTHINQFIGIKNHNQ